jgi:hypothetical protein
MHTALILALAILAEDPVPEDDDVVAGGWGAFFLVALVLATAFIAWSFVRQLRKAQAAKDAGVYGDEPITRDDAAGPPDES